MEDKEYGATVICCGWDYDFCGKKEEAYRLVQHEACHHGFKVAQARELSKKVISFFGAMAVRRGPPTLPWLLRIP